MSKRSFRDSPIAEPASLPALSLAAVSEPPQLIDGAPKGLVPIRKTRPANSAPHTKHFAAFPPDDSQTNRQAELFYLQKQIQLQTQMVFILEDGERIQGVIEWYDRNSIKVRGKSRLLIYKSAIKYLYKAGEIGSGPPE